MSRYLISPLSSTRSLLALTGPDSTKFLQGLVTNDILRKTSSPDASSEASTSQYPAIYAGFLSAQGRLTHDTFILPLSASEDPKANGFLIDYPKKVDSPTLLSYIKRYILRSKVKAKQTEDTLWAVYRNPLAHNDKTESTTQVEEELQHIASTSQGRFWRDTRAQGLGYRIAIPSTGLGALEATSFTSSSPSFHTLLRTISNVPETPTELPPGQALPLESNMDLMGGVDFRKGCYIGQELTARTYHTGVIRKRILPVRLYKAEEPTPTTLLPAAWTEISSVTEIPLPPNPDIKPVSSDGTGPKRPRAAGRIGSVLKVTSSAGEDIYLGLALLRLEMADKELSVDADAAAKEDGQEEAGVNAAGGNTADAAAGESLTEQWRVKPFRESLDGAK